MSRIICLVGPTATGKTKASIELAKKLDAVILNADSTGVYIEPLIATAKITESEKEGIPHYLLDIVSLNDDYTLYDYQKDGRKLLDKFISENRNVIIVGGSGLYIKALLYDYKLEESDIKKIDYSSYTNKELKSMADEIDIKNGIHTNNRQRLERYITFYKSFNKTVSKTKDIDKRLYDFDLIGLTTTRENLYKRINDRVDEMFNNGLLDEAKRLYDMNFKNYTNIIGYRELNEYFNGNITLDRAKELIKQNSRHYAKRQYTWFNNQMKDIKWFNTDYDNFDNTLNQIYDYLKIALK